MSDSTDVTRREALRLAVGTVAASQLARVRAAAAEPSLRFFTREEFALADTLCELIIPADDHSAGGRAAGAAQFIDGELAIAFTDEPRSVWRKGLALLNALASREHGRTFVDLHPSQQTAILERLAAREKKPESAEEQFFVELKRRTIHAYYTSRIGIHDELQYKGNTLLEEFAGTDVSRDR